MSDADSTEKKKPKGRGLLLGAGLSVLAAAVGFGSLYFDVIDLNDLQSTKESKAEVQYETGFTYLAIDPIIATVRGDQNESLHLKFSAQMEVNADKAEHVTFLMPRILDVLNTYLRAVQPQDLQDDFALIRLRAHILHRIDLVVGDDAVRDLLITEFVLS